MNIAYIKSDADYERALRRVEQLWTAREGSPEADELNALVTMIEAYEDEYYPMG
jgi:HTH-type transcriptional regulator/antitoxin HigA